MIQVTKASFFSVIGAMDVHPSIGPSPVWHPQKGYTSSWETRSREVLGKTHRDPGNPSENVYYVTEGIYQRHRMEAA